MSSMEAAKGFLEYNAKRQHFVLKDAAIIRTDTYATEIDTGDVSINEVLKNANGKNVTFILQVD